MKMNNVTGSRVLKQYDSHLITKDSPDIELYDYTAQGCMRCGKAVGVCSWAGIDEPEESPCYVIGEYKEGVLVHVYATLEYIKEHSFELKLFPPPDQEPPDDYDRY